MMRKLMKFLLLLFLIAGSQQAFAQQFTEAYKDIVDTRCRVIIDNDFGGDPDGLFQLAHHLLSPTVEIKAIIGSKQYKEGFYGYPGDAAYSVKMVNELLAVMKLSGHYPVVEGSSLELKDTLTPRESEGAKIIVQEAMREDTKVPLYVVCGAGLSNIASAWLMEPKIADRLTLIWIGGTEYEGLAWPPPGASYAWEYNTGIDAKAVQVIFNQSSIPIWQVPRDTYRQALVSYAEILYRVKNKGATGKYLAERLEDLIKRAKRTLGEAYALGDSPLVLLTALQSAWEVDPSSSKYALRPAPRVGDDALFESNPNGRPIRVYYDLDTRLMFGDFFAKLALFSETE